MEAKKFQLESVGGKSDQLDLHHVWTQPVIQMFFYYYQRSKHRGLILQNKLDYICASQIQERMWHGLNLCSLRSRIRFVFCWCCKTTRH